MESVFQKLIDNCFSDVAGLAADISLPMSETLVNEMITAALAGEGMIESCQVSIHEQNRVSVRLKTSVLPWPLNLRLKLDRAVDFASFSSPKMRAWLENNRMLGSLASLFHALPGWIKLYGNQVVVDLGYFLPGPDQKQLFEWVKSLDIRTEEGRLIFDIRIKVDQRS